MQLCVEVSEVLRSFLHLPSCFMFLQVLWQGRRRRWLLLPGHHDLQDQNASKTLESSVVTDRDQKWIQDMFHSRSLPALLRWRQRRWWWRLATVKLWVFCESNGVQVPRVVQRINTFPYIFWVFPGFPVTSTSTEGQDQRTDSHCQLSSDFKLIKLLRALVNLARLLFPERRWRRGWRLLRARWRLQPEDPPIGRSVQLCSVHIAKQSSTV